MDPNMKTYVKSILGATKRYRSGLDRFRTENKSLNREYNNLQYGLRKMIMIHPTNRTHRRSSDLPFLTNPPVVIETPVEKPQSSKKPIIPLPTLNKTDNYAYQHQMYKPKASHAANRIYQTKANIEFYQELEEKIKQKQKYPILLYERDPLIEDQVDAHLHVGHFPIDEYVEASPAI